MKSLVNRISLAFPLAALALACHKSPEPATSAPAASASAAPAVSATAAANAPFEGEIVVAVKGEASMKLPPSITYEVKGNKVRYVAATAPVYAIGDLDAQEAYTVDDAQRSYDAIDVKAPANAKPMPAPKVRKTAKSEKVAGLDCEDWTVEDGSTSVDVCAARGIAYFDLAGDAKAGSAETRWAAALTAEKAFPLRVVVHDKSGKEEYRAEATRADRKKLEDSIFKPPAPYKKADLAKETRTASLP
jgi:hypothetical protein